MKAIIFAFAGRPIKQDMPQQSKPSKPWPWSPARAVLGGWIVILIVLAGWIWPPWDRVSPLVGSTLLPLLVLQYRFSWNRLRIALPVATLSVLLALIWLRDWYTAAPLISVVLALIFSDGLILTEVGMMLGVGLVLAALLVPPADMTDHKLARARRRAREESARLHPPSRSTPAPESPAPRAAP